LKGVDPEASDLCRDGLGIAIDGLRTPWVDAPVATLSGQRDDSDDFSFGLLFGTTRSFSEEQLNELYAGGRDDWLTQFREATDRAVDGGMMLAEDRTEILAVASHSWPLSHPSNGGFVT
jgi:hypothetical protein